MFPKIVVPPNQFSIINHPFWGTPIILGNTHIYHLEAWHNSHVLVYHGLEATLWELRHLLSLWSNLGWGPISPKKMTGILLYNGYWAEGTKFLLQGSNGSFGAKHIKRWVQQFTPKSSVKRRWGRKGRFLMPVQSRNF